MLYSNDYINFDLINKNVLLFNLNKATPENNEWYEMKDALVQFFNCCLQKKFKVSLLFDITKQKLDISSVNDGRINTNVNLNEKRF